MPVDGNVSIQRTIYVHTYIMKEISAIQRTRWGLIRLAPIMLWRVRSQAVWSLTRSADVDRRHHSTLLW